ncbi:MAG: BTAD domain-containing putative transcriptional regulator [Jatrophihabitans sp.]|uniref:BTAD domain-containing putative transcriptional regulator n=1 Tax=Jatrophihabitans sp. TaxID=1932789 RepID=UPI003F80C467
MTAVSTRPGAVLAPGRDHLPLGSERSPAGAGEGVGVQYGVLGPLEVVRDGAVVDLGSPKQRAVLASLLLEPGRVVPTERIVDQVWGDDVPANVAASLQAYVSNLRRLLRDATATAPIVRQSPGYRLDVEADAVDAEQFRHAAEAARAALDAHDWPAAAAHATAGLALWRGEVLADFRDLEWVQVAAVALDERRTQCQEDLVTALLGADRTADALAAARTLHSAAPLRERSAWLHVVALYRSGRTTEALEVHRATVARLDEELGLDPGPALRDLQGALLRHDSELGHWPRTGPVVPVAVRVAAPASTPADDLAGMPAPPPPADADTTLVGRTAELDVVATAVEETAAGAVRWLVLEGPAGIGKTRLAEAVLDQARRRGFAVLRSGCPDDSGLPPWWPVAPLVRGLGGDPDTVLAQPAQAEADRARFAVHERVRELLTDAAARQPLVVLVDDVQWADTSSLGLLTHLAFSLEAVPVLLVLTARSGVTNPDLRRLFDAAARRTGSRRISVPPLAGAEIGELVQRISGEPITDREAALLLTRTGGNPFFVSESARWPRAERAAGEVPLAVRSVLDRRLGALDAGTLQVLRTAAVIGDVLEIDLLRRVTRLDVDELADLLDEAADERIVVIPPGGRHYAFAHGLLRDELLAGMSAARRQRLHARVAEAIGGDARGDDLVVRAGHLLAALPLADADEVFAACQEAARDAEARWQADAAAHWWEAALVTHGQLPPSRREQATRDELVGHRLRALIRAGRGQTVYVVVQAEIDAAVRDRRFDFVGTLCSMLMRSAGAWPWAAVGEGPGPLLETLQRAEPLVADDPAAHSRVQAALAIGSCYHPDGRVPDRLSRRALDLAETLGDADVLADALLARCLTFSGVAERVDESAALLDRLAALPHTAAAGDEVLWHGLMTMVCGHRGDMAGLAEHCRLGSAGSDRLRLPTSRVQFRLTESLLAQWQGRFDESERLFRDGERLRGQTELYFGWAGMSLIISRWFQGRLDSIADRLGAATDDLERISATVHGGDLDAAERLIADYLARPTPVVWTSHGDWTFLAHLVADAALTRLAPSLVQRLEPLRDVVALVGQLTVVGPVALALARLRLLLGQPAEARADLAVATELAGRGGGTPSLLLCRLVAARLDPPPPAELERVAADAAAAGLHGVARDAAALLAVR